MKFDELVLRFGELGLKGKNRKFFIDQLFHNVKEALHSFEAIRVKKQFDHIEIALHGTAYETVAHALRHVFGIQNMRPAVNAETDVEAIQAKALQLIQDTEYPINTFKVNAKRKYKPFHLNSMELNQVVGGHILKSTDGITVDVHHPDLEIQLEVMKQVTRLYGPYIPGAGGLPVGSSGKVLLMLSGGIDSPVAGHLMHKRGAQVEAIHFHSPPYTNDRARQKVVDLAETMKANGVDFKLHIIPFTNTQLAIRDRMPENYRMTIMRRMMMRMAERIAFQEQCLAIATGESLGQVASQTLESMNTINEVTNLPVLRPLLSMDKLDIMTIAKDINTYDISIRPYEDCCTLFLPKSPKTKPDRDHASRFEKNLPVEDLLQEALTGVETIDIGKQSDIIQDLF